MSEEKVIHIETVTTVTVMVGGVDADRVVVRAERDAWASVDKVRRAAMKTAAGNGAGAAVEVVMRAAIGEKP